MLDLKKIKRGFEMVKLVEKSLNAKDSEMRIVSVTDIDGDITQFYYDTKGRTVSVIFPFGDVVKFSIKTGIDEVEFLTNLIKDFEDKYRIKEFRWLGE